MGIDEILASVRYDHLTGDFSWKDPQKASSPCGHINGTGYKIIRVGRRLFRAHRIAFLLMTGNWPAHYVDHINGDRSDNRWHNLRSATNPQNQMNRGLDANNTSGVKGLSWNNKNKSWQAAVAANGKRYKKDFTTIRLGDSEKAKAAAVLWLESTRSALHGEFAHHGH